VRIAAFYTSKLESTLTICSGGESILLCSKQRSSHHLRFPLPSFLFYSRPTICVGTHILFLFRTPSNPQGSKYNSWPVTFMFSFCALAFAVGYILREVGAFSYGTVNVYIASMTIIYSLPYVFYFPDSIQVYPLHTHINNHQSTL
jgi:hypothetical protein